MLNNLKVHKLHKYCSTVQLKLHHIRVGCLYCTYYVCTVVTKIKGNLWNVVLHLTLACIILQLIGSIISKLQCTCNLCLS